MHLALLNFMETAKVPLDGSPSLKLCSCIAHLGVIHQVADGGGQKPGTISNVPGVGLGGGQSILAPRNSSANWYLDHSKYLMFAPVLKGWKTGLRLSIQKCQASSLSRLFNVHNSM